MTPGDTVALDGQVVTAGYPYGTIPRLLLTWLSTEAVRTKSREFPLGESLVDFTRQLGMGTTAGKGGQTTRLRDQMGRLFNARISVLYRDSTQTHEREAAKYLNVASEYDLWWSTKRSEQPPLWGSTVRLTQEFFDEVTNYSVPLNLTALRLLSGSPMRLDIYAWLTYRLSYLRKQTTLRWEQLMLQFGTLATTKQARRKFRLDFEKHLREVLAVYREARVTTEERGVTLRPSPPHVARGIRPVLAPRPAKRSKATS